MFETNQELLMCSRGDVCSHRWAQPGDWVSLRWSWVCEVLSPRQQANLARFTDYHLKLANQTL
jgi:hypothetical protein